MSLSESDIEEQIQFKHLNAPRVTPEAVDGVIVREDYYVFPGTTVTVCLLELQNGYCVTGTSAAASPRNFDAELGRQIARSNAREQIWELEAYLLRDRLADGADG